nr:hypothetical protein [Thermanaeromonas toyohensis]
MFIYFSWQQSNCGGLLSKMDYSPKERLKLKIEFLRMITRMELDPAKLGFPKYRRQDLWAFLNVSSKEV